MIRYNIWNSLCSFVLPVRLKIFRSKVFIFFKGIMSAPEKPTAPHTFCTSKHAQSASGANCPEPLFRDHNVVKTNLHLINSNN